jgi:hypothetical protein
MIALEAHLPRSKHCWVATHDSYTADRAKRKQNRFRKDLYVRYFE